MVVGLLVVALITLLPINLYILDDRPRLIGIFVVVVGVTSIDVGFLGAAHAGTFISHSPDGK